jgi:hypothetical protein
LEKKRLFFPRYVINVCTFMFGTVMILEWLYMYMPFGFLIGFIEHL